MEKLALLKFGSAADAGPKCPPADVWIEVAAGVSSLHAEKYLRHAVICDHCGQLLHRAAGYFANDLTPQEEAKIAGLSSAGADWQTQLAARLSGTKATAPELPRASYGWFAPFAASFATSRIAYAVVLLAIFGLGLRDYWLERHLSTASTREAAEMSRLRQDVVQQETHIAELNAQLNQHAAEPTPAQQSSNVEHIATLSLETGLSRGTGEMKRLSIPADANLVKFTLQGTDSSRGAMHEELLTFDRKKLWSQDLRPSDAERSSGSLTLFVPAYLLSPDDYQIVLSHALPEGAEEVATYSFRVPR